jgi:hypothetical protein
MPDPREYAVLGTLAIAGVLLAYHEGMQMIFTVAWCGLLLAAGCSGGSGAQAAICERLANPPDKHGTCGPLVVNITIYDEAKCNTAMADCSANDEKALTAFTDCYAAVPPCELGHEVTFTSKAFACVAVATVSSACQMALDEAAK